MARIVEGLSALCLVILGYGICWVSAVRPLRRIAAARYAAGKGGRQRLGGDHVETAVDGLPDPDELSQVAGPLQPQDRRVPAEAVAGPDEASSDGSLVVGPGIMYFERLEFFIAEVEPLGAEPRFRLAVERDLVPLPVRYNDPEALARQAREDSNFRDRLEGTAADYLVGKYGDPVVDCASRQVWVTSQSFPETDLAGICGRVSDRLATITEWPLTEAGSGLGVPAPVDAAGAAIGAGLILEPVTRPLGKFARFCEVVGVGIGVLTGCHPLVLASAKLLAKGEIHDQMARGIVEAGKLVARGELLPRAEPRDRPAAAEHSRQEERPVSSEAHPMRRPPGAPDRRRSTARSGWNGRSAVGQRDGRSTRPEPYPSDNHVAGSIWDGRPARPGADWQERDGTGDAPYIDGRNQTREPHPMAPGRPGAHEPWEEPEAVREPYRQSPWDSGRYEHELGRDVNQNRDGDNWGRGGRT